MQIAKIDKDNKKIEALVPLTTTSGKIRIKKEVPYWIMVCHMHQEASQ